MLTRISISNYALINNLSIEFTEGLNTVTGETGAGKSIILGALGLILGNRADLSVLKNKSEKCIVEGLFDIGNYNTGHFFAENDLDYETSTILRREITVSGKSRAFINDTPVNAKTLRELGLMLIDIHSQHQNLELSNQKFQLGIVDTVANSFNVLSDYQNLFAEYLKIKKYFEELKAKSEKENADLDYFQFQFNQLEEANLKENEQLELENELEQLTHAEDIKGALLQARKMLNSEPVSVIQSLKESQKIIEKIQNYISEIPALAERLKSSFFELQDILDEIDKLAEKIEFNPQRIELINDRLNLIYSLQQKHHVKTVQELIELKNEFDEKIVTVVGYSDEINEVKQKIDELQNKLQKKAIQLTELRKKSFSKIEKSVVSDLQQLGMLKSRFTIKHESLTEFGNKGCDAVSFYFSANSDSELDEISKIASGGEMSRLMLSIKNLLRSSKSLPTVIFDEIDSGVSGEIAVKMGNILKSFSTSTQIINITHLPQIAAKGDTHFHVYKFEEKGKTFTSIKKLVNNERVEELAKMISGDNLSESTLKIAEELLSN